MLPSFGIWFTSFNVAVEGRPYWRAILPMSPVKVLGLPWLVTKSVCASCNFFVKLVSAA